MRQKRSHVVIFCAYLGMVAYGNLAMFQLGWTVWGLFVAVFAVAGLVMARVMFKEPKQATERPDASESQSPTLPAPSSGSPSSRRWPFRSSRPRAQSPPQAAATPPASSADSIVARLNAEYRLKMAEAGTLRDVLDILDSFSRAMSAEGKKDPVAGGTQDAIRDAKELLSTDPKSWDEAEIGTDLGPITLNLRKGQQAAAEPQKEAQAETAFDAGGAEDVSS